MTKYKYIKILFMLTCIMTAFVSMIHLDTSASVDTKKQIIFGNIGIEKLKYPAEGNGYDKIYFGNYGGLPLQWDILNPKESSFGSSDSILLLTSGLVGNSPYGDMMTDDYTYSILRSYIQNTMSNISPKEENVVINSQRSAYGPYMGIKDSIINDKFFAPTLAMMTNPQYGFSSDILSDENRSLSAAYWLSAKSFTVSYNACAVQINGLISAEEHNIDIAGVRVATNLDSSSVLLISDAVGSKSMNVGAALKGILESMSNEYKLTIKDTSQKLDVPTNIKVCGDELSFNYSSSGDGQYLSAIMTDETGREILSYGKIKDISTEKTASATIKLPSDFFDNHYRFKIFTEIDNGDRSTDYASQIIELPVPDPYTITIHYKDADGNDVEKTIWATDHVDISAYVPKPDDILSDVDGYRLPDNWEWQYDKEGTSFSDVTKEFTASPPYIKTWKVNYLDDQGEPVQEVQIIDDGMDALEPTPPIKPLYHFKKWDQSSKNIQKDMNIQAMYTPYVYTIRTEQETYTVGTLQIRRLFGTLSGEEIEKKLLQFYHTELYEGNEIQHHEHIKVIGDIETLRKGIAGEYTIQYQYINEMDENFHAEKSVTFIIREASGIAPEEPKIPEQSIINHPRHNTEWSKRKDANKQEVKEVQLVNQHMTTEDGISFLKICIMLGSSVLGMIVLKKKRG